jgi:hypothetical protein
MIRRRGILWFGSRQLWYNAFSEKKGSGEMAYFLSHIIYIVVAAIFIAAHGIIAVVAANKSQKESMKHRDDKEWMNCEREAGCQGCAGCKFFQFCDPVTSDADTEPQK